LFPIIVVGEEIGRTFFLLGQVLDHRRRRGRQRRVAIPQPPCPMRLKRHDIASRDLCVRSGSFPVCASKFMVPELTHSRRRVPP